MNYNSLFLNYYFLHDFLLDEDCAAGDCALGGYVNFGDGEDDNLLFFNVSLNTSTSIFCLDVLSDFLSVRLI